MQITYMPHMKAYKATYAGTILAVNIERANAIVDAIARLARIRDTKLSLLSIN